MDLAGPVSDSNWPAELVGVNLSKHIARRMEQTFVCCVWAQDVGGYRCTVADAKSLEGIGFDAKLFGGLACSGSWPVMCIIFDGDHARVMTELAGFTGALRYA
jgi:hypothetical protein